MAVTWPDVYKRQAKGRIRSLVGKSLGWRVTPELRFFIDPSVDAAERIASLFSDEG